MNNPNWWRDAVIYQIYPRSFVDADGDGMGDVQGIISRLDYLQSLNIDALWISPFYASPLHDGGYDVADYRVIDPRLGTVDEVKEMLDQAHARNLKVFFDLVPNHTSVDHAWFQEVLNDPPGSPSWDRYMIREGKGANRELPPNNWTSVFHGAGWTQLEYAGKSTGYWYLHIFDTSQPDLNWENPEVIEEFHSILRFWFDLGVDGFRIDVAHGLRKDPALPDVVLDQSNPDFELLRPYWDQDSVHEVYRGWREIADEYPDKRVFCGEAWVATEERLSLYLRNDELHTCFNFNYLQAGWDAIKMHEVIDQTIATHAKVGAPPTWVLSNHDVIRHRTRLAPIVDGEPDLERGLARARAATLFALSLPGSAYIYQGEELGLEEVTDLAPEVRQDPAWLRSGGTDGKRDGCRVPLPWDASSSSFGFSANGESWLPLPAHWAELTVAQQSDDPDSTLNFYRRTLALRKAEPSLGEGPLQWLDARNPEVLAFQRGETATAVVSVINLGDDLVHLPANLGTEVLATSGDAVAVLDTSDGQHVVIGGETAVWLRAK
ncbi:MAG: glycoside hydrolase family 13 protein [Candidatus Nanopelagicales bacterium]|nr:glycoside hydrolase family 13 protein [Candidatus Nanopelagicales bacterium]